jgi:cell cycle checkpoint protein
MPRRKKVIVSDEEESPKPSPAKKGSIEAAFGRASKQTPTPSPSKKPAQASKPSAKPNGDIQSFFKPAAGRQSRRQSARRPPSHTTPTASPERDTEELELKEDEIRGSSEDEKGSPRGTKRKVDAVEDARNGRSPRNGKPAFLHPTDRVVNGSRPPLLKQEQRPWTDEYGPLDLDELAVHKRKVQDVHTWLTQALAGKDCKRLLILRGGAGTGKTTTVRLLAKKFGLKLNEWTNPDSKPTSAATSLTSQFEDFVHRTSVYGTLSFDNMVAEEESGPQSRRVILVEEFPSTYSRSSSTLSGFRNAVLQYLTVSTPSPEEYFSRRDETVVPVIMVISEALLTTATSSADSFTAYRLLGPDILNHPGTTTIEFKAIAPTFMLKALDLVLRKEARRSGRRFAPGPAVLKHISETGDIRSAVSALELLCIHHGSASDWSGKIAFTKAKKSTAENPVTALEARSLQMITQRESTLGIFHAVGKVVHNKRELPAATDALPPQPPSYFPQHERLKVSEVDVDKLLNDLGTDISVFISGLHENYALSCGGLTEEETLDSLNGCVDALSDSDILCPDRFGLGNSRLLSQMTTNDTLRQDAISYYRCVQGMLFNLPHPVKRLPPPSEYLAGRGKSGSHGAAFQMLYPTSHRLWRQVEQTEQLIELFKTRFRSGDFDAQVKTKRQSQFGGSWGKASSNTKPEIEELVARDISKSDLLLERLPYVQAIVGRGSLMSKPLLLKQLEKLVSFVGLASFVTHEEDGAEDDAPAEQWSTDKPEGETRRNHTTGLMSKGAEVRKDMEKLVLSEDDIDDF